MSRDEKTTQEGMDEEGLDFERCGDEDLGRAIDEAGKALRNRYLVRFPYLWAQTHGGGRYRLPLKVRASDLAHWNESATELEQITSLLLKANPGKKRDIEGELTVSLLAIADKYATVLERVQAASLGKSSASSGS